MSQAVQVDDTKLANTITNLKTKYANINQQAQAVKDLISKLQKIQIQVVRTDIVDNVPAPVTSQPMDGNTGEQMTEQTRLSAYNTLMPKASAILGNTTQN